MGARKRANYYIQYTKRQRFPFNIYVYREGRAYWIASVEYTKDADAIVDAALTW